MKAIERYNVAAFAAALEGGASLTEELFWQGMRRRPDRFMFQRAALLGTAELLEVAVDKAYDIREGLRRHVPLDMLLGYCGTSPGSELLAFVLRHHPDDWKTYRDGEGNSLLHKFVQEDRYQQVQALLDAGADPNARNAKGQTPVFFAKRPIELATLQSTEQLDLSACDNQGRSVLRHLSDELQRHVEKKKRRPDTGNGAISGLSLVMMVICSTHPLVDDPHARVIARRIKRMLDDDKLAIVQISDSFNLLGKQADQVMSLVKRDQLKQLATKPRRNPTLRRAL